MHQTPKSFGGARTCSRSSITVPSLVGLGFHRLPGWPKMLTFCLPVCLFVTFFNVRDCAPDFAMKASTETILMPLDRGRFVVVHPCSTFSDCCELGTPQNAEVQKWQNFGFFAARGRQNEPIETKFGTSACTLCLL